MRVHFSLDEATILLDAHLKVERGEIKRGDAAIDVSEKLRRLATIRGMSFDNSFRPVNGIQGRLTDIGKMYDLDKNDDASGKSSSLWEAVVLYKKDPKQFKKLYNEIMQEIEFRSDRLTELLIASKEAVGNSHEKWDVYEIIILFEAMVSVLSGKLTRKEAYHNVSIELRQRAIRLGNDIDEIFRNENGIKLQMDMFLYEVTDGVVGLKSHLKPLFRGVIDLYKNDRKAYDFLLQRARSF